MSPMWGKSKKELIFLLKIKLKSKSFIRGLQALWKIKEYQYISDSEKLEIVLGVYELDPEFFMSSIFPEMKTWKFPSFLKLKSEIFEILNKKGA